MWLQTSSCLGVRFFFRRLVIIVAFTSQTAVGCLSGLIVLFKLRLGFLVISLLSPCEEGRKVRSTHRPISLLMMVSRCVLLISLYGTKAPTPPLRGAALRAFYYAGDRTPVLRSFSYQLPCPSPGRDLSRTRTLPTTMIPLRNNPSLLSS